MSSDTSPEAANRMRWAFQPGHYEVWYATLSHAASRTGFWIRYTLESPAPGHGAPSARLWFARFDGRDAARTFGFSREFPIGELRHEPSPFRVRIGDAELRHDGMKGRLTATGEHAHEVEWDLRWTPSNHLHRHLPSLIYATTVADTQVLSPNLDVAAHGTIVVDGERYLLAGDPLGQTHLWGRKHAYSWAWSHCNAFDGAPGCALETLTVRLRRGSLVTPKMTMLSLYLDGSAEPIEFREPWELPLARSDYGTGRYTLRAEGPLYRVEAEYSCRPDDMILTEYVDPDGEPAFCHNTECADAHVKVWRRTLPLVGAWQELRTLTSERGAHFEWGARAGDPLVKKRHVRVD